jgi:hypothetical protein
MTYLKLVTEHLAGSYASLTVRVADDPNAVGRCAASTGLADRFGHYPQTVALLIKRFREDRDESVNNLRGH